MTSNSEKIDVFIATYNSEAHLQECIDSVSKALPVMRIVIIDHHSTDSTHEIARRNSCEVVLEDKGLAYARELSFRLAQTDVFAMVESDLVYQEFGWYERAKQLLRDRVAAVVAFVPRGTGETRGKYNEFWSRHTPLRARRHGFSAGSTLLRREAVKDISLPESLGAYEDIYLLRKLRSRGWTYRWVEVKGLHYSDLGSLEKARWYGANARILYGLDPDITLIRRHLMLPVKGIIASIMTLDPEIFVWSVRYASSFFSGWREPERLSFLKR